MLIFQQIFLFLFYFLKFPSKKSLVLVGCEYKKKLCCKILKFYHIQDKPNFKNIFKSYLNYCDFKGLHNSFDYFARLWKNKIYIITFRSIKILWGFFIKTLHTLNVPRLYLPNKIKDL